ncbi:hypothetical protein MCUN1_000804 [Malassezia cuniculi]|uniref:Uncharacterized protein n=1 Tax=Malassezia cuniculi TaxID=948313 RepID=A0AAF0JA50_9BASI|nr:hypothetical protein MCUN1_000804 [Malassezia cuniculi]
MASAAVDDVSLILIVAILALLITFRLQRHWKQPALHQLILTHQAEASQVRSSNESPVYRNVNAPIGLDLAMRPQRSTPDVPGLLLDGLSPSDAALARRVFDAALSNADLLEQASRLAHGLAALLPGESRTLVVHGGVASARAVVALLAGAGFKGFPKVVTAVLPADVPLKELPVEGPVAVLTDSRPSVDALVIPLSTEAAIAHDNTRQWEDVLGAGAPAALPTAEPVRATTLELDEIGQRPFAWFFDKASSAWLITTHTSMTSGVTSILSEYPADLIPAQQDTIAIGGLDPASPIFASIVLTALYTGAGLSHSTSTTQVVRSVRPSIIYTSGDGAEDLAESLHKAAPPSFANALYKRHLYALRHGIIPRNDLADRIVGSEARRTVGADNVRNVAIFGGGCAAGQDLLDKLRVYLAVPVIHAYVPQTAKAGTVPVALTCPISASNVYDFQAFAAIGLGERELAAHVGPPSVSLEMKIVTDTQVAEARASVISRLRADTTSGTQDDTIGEIFVRGYSVASASIDTVTPSSRDFIGSEWIATGDVGLVRTNGTIVVVQESLQKDPGVPRVRARRTRGGRVPLVSLICLFFLAIAGVEASSFERRDVNAVMDSGLLENAIASLLAAQRSSWEQGVAQSALLEALYPKWSVFSAGYGSIYPDRSKIDTNTIPKRVLTMAYHSVAAQDPSGRLCTLLTGDEQLYNGAALDSASCGDAVLLASWIYEGFVDGKPNATSFWGGAVTRQLDYIQTNVSRSNSGAISQRAHLGDVQAWSDTTYMMPPFLAQYGLMTNNRSLLVEAYDQIRLYRNLLSFRNGTEQDLWGHIRAVTNSGLVWYDRRAWLTGNGWAAAGMLKVAATIQHSSFADELQSQRNDLIQWAEAVINAVDKYFDTTASLYHNQVNNASTFLDAAGSSLLAYSAFRLAALDRSKDHTGNAEKVYGKLRDSFDPTGAFVNVETVNELDTGNSAPTSSESLAFLVMLQSARRDYLNGTSSDDTAGSTPVSAGHSLLAHISMTTIVAIFAAIFSLIC